MLNQSVLAVLQDTISLNALNKFPKLEPMNKEDLKAFRNESENLCESIEYGLMNLGDMMLRLGFLADDKDQNSDHVAMTNDNAKHIGGLIKANAYLLNALRESAELAEYYLSHNDKSNIGG